MRSRKSRKANIEKRRGTNLLIGLIVATAFTLTAFEWTTRGYVATVNWDDFDHDFIEEEVAPVSPSPKKKEKPKVINPDKFEIGNPKPDPDPDPNPDPEPDPDPIVLPGFTTDSMPDEPVVIEEFRIVEDMPVFSGGNEALRPWLARQTKYPQIDVDAGNSGKVWVTFVIDEFGHVRDAEVVRGVSKTLDEEALRVIRAMPKWKPGKQRGTPVRVRFEQSIDFILR